MGEQGRVVKVFGGLPSRTSSISSSRTPDEASWRWPTAALTRTSLSSTSRTDRQSIWTTSTLCLENSSVAWRRWMPLKESEQTTRTCLWRRSRLRKSVFVDPFQEVEEELRKQ